MKQLNIQDAGFIYQETSLTPMHISGLGLYNQEEAIQPRLSLQATAEYIQARLHHCPILQQKIFHVPGQLGRPYWVKDEQFQIERHIKIHHLPKPGNIQQLHQLVSELISQPLDFHQPLWECHIIEGLNQLKGYGKHSFALLTKVHHSCIDGASGSNVITVLHDFEPNGKPMPLIQEPNTSESAPGKFELMAKNYAANLWAAYGQTFKFTQRIPLLSKVAIDLFKGNIETGGMLKAPTTRFNKTPSQQRVFLSVDFDLSAIKKIKNTFCVTINDVMVAIVAGALRHYLNALGELPEASLGAMLPKNIRTEKTQQAKQGNQVGGLITKLHTHIADASERLKAIHQSTQQAKAFSEYALTDHVFPYLMGGFLYPRAGKAFSHWSQKHALMEKIGPIFCNTVITNVPGPNFRLYHAGAPMQSFMGVPPLPDGIGLAHAIYSYCGSINISVLSCAKMLEDTSLYSQCLTRSFEELLAATEL